MTQTQTASAIDTETEQPTLRLVELAGDGIRRERGGCKYCLGCPVCESELEDEF